MTIFLGKVIVLVLTILFLSRLSRPDSPSTVHDLADPIPERDHKQPESVQ